MSQAGMGMAFVAILMVLFLTFISLWALWRLIHMVLFKWIPDSKYNREFRRDVERAKRERNA